MPQSQARASSVRAAGVGGRRRVDGSHLVRRHLLATLRDHGAGVPWQSDLGLDGQQRPLHRWGICRLMPPPRPFGRDGMRLRRPHPAYALARGRSGEDDGQHRVGVEAVNDDLSLVKATRRAARKARLLPSDSRLCRSASRVLPRRSAASCQMTWHLTGRLVRGESRPSLRGCHVPNAARARPPSDWEAGPSGGGLGQRPRLVTGPSGSQPRV